MRFKTLENEFCTMFKLKLWKKNVQINTKHILVCFETKLKTIRPLSAAKTFAVP